ncbi:MAG TPA: competence protein ComK [Bacillaceae bacterium]|nr:competence protein ComK [Paenibacillus bovis]HLU22866.1 competence protein ComK [Bacillaceae bacterium]
MFDERIALRMRLEQMNEAEERLLSELRKERAFIFNRLRELDELQEHEDLNHQSYTSTVEMNSHSEHKQELLTPMKKRRARPSRRSKTTKMRETAVEILTAERVPMRSSELQKIIEEKTGFTIANMTTFMNTIMKIDTNIEKLGRGLYTYRKNNKLA